MWLHDKSSKAPSNDPVGKNVHGSAWAFTSTVSGVNAQYIVTPVRQCLKPSKCNVLVLLVRKQQTVSNTIG